MSVLDKKRGQKKSVDPIKVIKLNYKWNEKTTKSFDRMLRINVYTHYHLKRTTHIRTRYYSFEKSAVVVSLQKVRTKDQVAKADRLRTTQFFFWKEMAKMTTYILAYLSVICKYLKKICLKILSKVNSIFCWNWKKRWNIRTSTFRNISKNSDQLCQKNSEN